MIAFIRPFLLKPTIVCRGLQPIASQEEILLPAVDIENPHMPLLLYLDKSSASLYRVWSGEISMHKARHVWFTYWNYI